MIKPTGFEPVSPPSRRNSTIELWLIMEQQMGFEPTTPSLEKRNSTIELLLQTKWNQKGSNLRRLALQANALPTELWFHSYKQLSSESIESRTRNLDFKRVMLCQLSYGFMVRDEGIEPTSTGSKPIALPLS